MKNDKHFDWKSNILQQQLPTPTKQQHQQQQQNSSNHHHHHHRIDDDSVVVLYRYTGLDVNWKVF